MAWRLARCLIAILSRTLTGLLQSIERVPDSILDGLASASANAEVTEPALIPDLGNVLLSIPRDAAAVAR